MKPWILIPLLFSGCIEPPSGAPLRSDTGNSRDADGSGDVGTTDVSRPFDAGRTLDAGGADVSMPDADVGEDAGMRGPCDRLGLPIGLWRMENAVGDLVASTGSKALPDLILRNAVLEPGRGGTVLTSSGMPEVEPFISDDPAFDLDSGTVSVWVRANDAGLIGDRGLLSRDASQQARNGHWTVELDGGKPYARLQNTQTEVELWLNPIAGAEWVHVTFSWREGEVRLSANGSDVVREPPGWSVSGNDNPIGVAHSTSGSAEGQAGGNSHFDGSIDDIAIWDRWLTSEELVLLADDACPLE